MRVTSKGQVTVPKHIRDAIGVGPGSNIEFELVGGKAVIVNLDSRQGLTPGQQLAKHMQEMARKAKRIPMTTDELMELTRGPFNDLDSR